MADEKNVAPERDEQAGDRGETPEEEPRELSDEELDAVSGGVTGGLGFFGHDRRPVF